MSVETSTTTVTETTDGRDVPVWAIRLEAKVDVALVQHAARLDTHALDIADHEGRLRAVEGKATVSPLGLWTAVIGGLGGTAALAALINTIVRVNGG